jgi:hypothetical protein
VSHAAFRDDLFGKLTHAIHCAFQQNGLDALIMIQMGVQRRDGQIMVSVLDAGQALGQFPFMMIVNVG